MAMGCAHHLANADTSHNTTAPRAHWQARPHVSCPDRRAQPLSEPGRACHHREERVGRRRRQGDRRQRVAGCVQMLENVKKVLPTRSRPRVTRLYGPAVRCKSKVKNGGGWSCASVSGPCMERCAPGHHGYPRAPDLILGKALRGRLGHQITCATARPFLHLLNPTRRPRQVSVASGISLGHPSAGPNALILCDLWFDARFVAATLCQHSPSDPRQLIGECGCQDVMV